MKPNEAEVASPATSTEQPNAAADAQAPGAASADTDAKTAESSAADATDAKKEPSLLDVVRDAAQPAKAPEDSSTAGGETEQPAEAAEAAEAATEAETDADLPFHKHARFQQLLRERNEAQEAAGAFQQIQTFMQEHGLEDAEVAEGFEVMALLKRGDDASLRKALEWFEPRIAHLREAVGEVLPDDLLARVDDGELDEETAKELARLRATSTLRSRQDEESARRAEAAQEARQRQERSVALATAVETWERDLTARDPDFAKKQDLIASATLAMVHKEGAPQTPEAAVALAQRAYDQVTAAFAAALPKRTAVDTRTPAGSSAPTTAAPRTLEEAIKAAVAR